MIRWIERFSYNKQVDRFSFCATGARRSPRRPSLLTRLAVQGVRCTHVREIPWFRHVHVGYARRPNVFIFRLCAFGKQHLVRHDGLRLARDA